MNNKCRSAARQEREASSSIIIHPSSFGLHFGLAAGHADAIEPQFLLGIGGKERLNLQRVAHVRREALDQHLVVVRVAADQAGELRKNKN